MCNNWLKFGKLFDYADSVGAQYVATGHYARLATDAETGDVCLSRGVDPGKDQSYVLFGVERRLLSRMLLPMGHYHKGHIREIATGLGLRVANKKDSQEICFVTSGKHADFVRANLHDQVTAGRIVTTGGDVVGSHAGIERFTVGQRKGLGVAMGQRFFVVHIDSQTNDVVIGQRHELARDTLEAERLNWLADAPASPFRCSAQIRYNSFAKPAVAELVGEDRMRIRFDEAQHGVAPGQAVVCYQGMRVLGGGWIV
jgi:tRNA-specific 2-thiouridylase